MSVITPLKRKIKNKAIKLVFPEGEDARVLQAASRLQNEHLVQPILLGDNAVIKKRAGELKLNYEQFNIINPKTYQQDNATQYDKLVKALVQRRQNKITMEQAQKKLLDVNYLGTMLVYLNLVQGMVSGAAHSTAATIRPALQIIKARPGVKKVSGSFLMEKGDDTYLLADCAINITLTSSELAEVAGESAKKAQSFGIQPKVALLSFSTKGSAKSKEVNKVQTATKLAKAAFPNLAIDGELQVDAALDPIVAKVKAPDSLVAGRANVLIFPSLEAANIAYKLLQRLGNFDAIGPLLQGLNKPVSDLSRGADIQEIYKVGIVTAAETLEVKA